MRMWQLERSMHPNHGEGNKMRAFFLTLLLLIAVPAMAQPKKLLNVDKNDIAIKGYDPVAFFTQNKPVKGNPQFASDYNGARYLFASTEDKATFDANPGKYEPQFGGFCAYAVSRGRTAPIKVEAFQIVNGRLLLQYDLDILKEFQKDTQGNLKKADQNWPSVVEREGH
jgi:YHS domain-containing protein